MVLDLVVEADQVMVEIVGMVEQNVRRGSTTLAPHHVR